MEEKVITPEQQQEISNQAKKQADAFVRKNRKELHRLRAHAENSILTNNKPAYKYAVGKLRTMLKQSSSDELLETLWQSNKQALINLINEVEG